MDAGDNTQPTLNMPMKALASLFLPASCQVGSGLCEQSCSLRLRSQRAPIPLLGKAGTRAVLWGPGCR